ncbi:MAG TPA: hypothetical protein VK034_06050, partial [Enhygromyxa sp.]|nr:hypothetical protein [Enhygromyxa sp.]
MSRRLVRLASTFTLGAWMASIACTSSDPAEVGRKPSAEGDGAPATEPSPKPVDVDADPDSDSTSAESSAATDETGTDEQPIAD